MINPDNNAFPGEYSRGLTIREYFAALALQGLLANPNVVGSIGVPENPDYDDQLAKEALDSADALIKALNEQG